MKKTLDFDAAELFEVTRGLELRIAECEKQFTRARSETGKSEWGLQLHCARRTLIRLEDAQR